MAIFEVYVGWFDDPEGTSFSVSSGLDELAFLEAGDVVRFFRSTGFGITSDTIDITGFDAEFWTGSATSVSVPTGTGFVSRTVNSGNPDPTDDLMAVNFGDPGSTNISFTATVSVPDTTPDAFDWPDVVDAEPGEAVDIGADQITGINRITDISVTNADFYVRSNSGTRLSTTVVDQDFVYLDTTAPASYNQTKVVTVTVGTVTVTVNVSTRVSPLIDQTINIGIPSGIIKLKDDLYNFFGGDAPNDVRLTDYYSGGTYVPNITGNESVPTSGQIKLTDFYDAVTAYFFTVSPLGKSDSANTLDNGQTLNLVWNKTAGDWAIGFGANLELVSEYKYVLTREDNESTVVTLSSETGSEDPAIFSLTNTYARISATVPSNNEKILYGKLQIHARNQIDNSYSIMREVSWLLIFYGP